MKKEKFDYLFEKSYIFYDYESEIDIYINCFDVLLHRDLKGIFINFHHVEDIYNDGYKFLYTIEKRNLKKVFSILHKNKFSKYNEKNEILENIYKVNIVYSLKP